MFDLLKKLIFRNKSPINAWILVIISCTTLIVIRAPLSITREIAALYLKKDFFRAMESFLWLLNRSYLRVNDKGIRFNIGDALSDKCNKQLLASYFVERRDTNGVHKGQLILSGLQHNPQSQFWLKQFRNHFGDYKNKMKKLEINRSVIGSPKTLVKEEDGINALRDFSRLYSSIPGQIFLVSGTFLGLIREGKFLGHDYDIDLGCFAEEFDLKLLLDSVERSPHFFLKEINYYFEESSTGGVFKRSDKPFLVKILHSTYITIDLFVHFKRGKEIVHGTSIHLWKNRQFKMERYSFYNMDWHGADDYDTYLTENYGDWRKEKKVFDCDFDTPNLSFPSTPAAYLHLLARSE